MRHALLLLCFFVSGVSALVYEVVWQRMLTLVFGVSTFSVAAVVAALLAGLALGAKLFGGFADRSARPARLYAMIEVTIAILGFASLYLVPWLMDAFVAIHHSLEPGWLGSNLIRFFLALAALLIPSIFIGGTVPVMARLVTHWSTSVAVGFGIFYAINTLGGLAGAALAGFVLIPNLGVTSSIYAAIGGNVAVALIAILAGGRRMSRPVAEIPSAAPPKADGRGASAAMPTVALGIAFLAGFVSLTSEIVWTRLLAIFTYNSVYVFTMVLSIFLGGIAIGSGVTAALLRIRPVPVRILQIVQILIALAAPLTLFLTPAAVRLDITNPSRTGSEVLLLEFALAALLILPPTILMGMSLPLVVAMLNATLDRAGRAVGRVYAWNSAGTILGAALAGVALVPFLGLRGTLLLAAGLSMLVAAWSACMDDNAPRVWRGLPHFGAVVFVFLVAFMPPETRFFRPPPEGPADIVYYAEGPSATVHVAEFTTDRGKHRALYVDSKSVAGTYDEIVTDQKMLAHLPLLLHPDPQMALTVGFGTGGTSYSMLQHKIVVHCAEIEPRVPEAFRLFEDQNAGIVGPSHNRHDFQLILDDARSWLYLAPKPYDAIVTDVTSIQYRGNGNLYTTDYFDLMRRDLTPTGLGCAWVPISGITTEQLKILVRSFQDIYEHTSVWYMVNMPTDFVILVGTPERLEIDLADIAARMDAKLIHRDLESIGMENPYKLAACLLLAEADVTRYVGDGPLHTDDKPVLDYLTHASTYINSLTENLDEMLKYRSNPADYVTTWPNGESAEAAADRWAKWYDAAGHLMEGHALLHRNSPDRFELAAEAYRKAHKLIPDDAITIRLINEMVGPE